NVCELPANAAPNEPNNLVDVDHLGVFYEPDDPDERQRWKAIGGGHTQVTWPYAATPPTRRPLWLGGIKPPPQPDPPPPLRGGLHDLFISPDGIRWTRKCTTALPGGAIGFNAPYERPTGTSMLRVRWDPKLKKYIANTKRVIGPDLHVSPIYQHARAVATCESDDLIHWSSP
ncbi:MAG: hypothetical protein QF577_11140, partial [Phycisphaerae bacterium]|nr:hypothetical protein [Phycisphaerae bacterium]